MRRLLRDHVPERVWENLATLSIFGALVVLAFGFFSLQNSRLESCQRTYRSFPLMFRPFFPADQSQWTSSMRGNWDKLQTRADDLAGQCGKQIHPFLFQVKGG